MAQHQLLELSGSLEYVLPFDRTFRDKPIHDTYVVTSKTHDPYDLQVTHNVGRPQYDFKVIHPADYDMPTTRSATNYELFVNPETSEAVLFVARSVVAHTVGVQCTEVAVNLPDDLAGPENAVLHQKAFQLVFQDYCDRLTF